MAGAVKKQFDPKETYIVREVLCCGDGHCPGVRYTHWEVGEMCIIDGHEEGRIDREVHFYPRLVLVPLYRGTKEDPYSKENGKLWDYLNLDDNVNRWSHFVLAPKGMKEGQKITPN